MKFQKKFLNLFLIFLLVLNFEKAFAAFTVQSVELTKDNNICVLSASGTITALNLSNLQSSSESVQSNITSSGSLCPTPPFFSGGAIQTTTSGIKSQAIPTVQGLGRGILISEVAGNSSGVSSSGDPTGFNTLITTLGGVATSIFEISLPQGCDVIDDDDDIVGASSDLSLVNDFTLPTCASTNGLTVDCNAASGLLTAINGLVPATSSTPAKIRFVITSFNTVADINMIDSILIKFDSQDIFCPSTQSSPLTATIIAKNSVETPTKTETIGTADLGTPIQAAKINYATNTATSLKGETSTNEIGITPVLQGASTTTLNTIQIEELHNESIPIGNQSSATIINPSVASNTAEINNINLWLIPSSTTLFSSAPQIADITFSDNSIFVSSAPYLVMTNTDDLNAPIGSIVIQIRKNPDSTNPANIKTIIKINNLSINNATAPTVSLAFYEPVSGAIVNTPGGLSVNDSTNPTNPQNFSALSAGSTRALVQNVVIGGAVNEATAASQITSDTDLLALATKDSTIGTPQISTLTKLVSQITAPDTSKITTTVSNSVVTITGASDATIGGAKVKIDSITNSQTYDSVTIISKSDGSFTAKVQADFSKGDITLNFKQTISNTDSTASSKTVSKPSTTTLSCEQTVCGCENIDCTPAISSINSYISNNGGLSSIVSTGGAVLDELIKSAKKALGLS